MKGKFLNVAFAQRPDVRFEFCPSQFGGDGAPLELAYALTVHKAQGSEFGVVFLVLPKRTRSLSRELAVHRAYAIATAPCAARRGTGREFPLRPDQARNGPKPLGATRTCSPPAFAADGDERALCGTSRSSNQARRDGSQQVRAGDCEPSLRAGLEVRVRTAARGERRPRPVDGLTSPSSPMPATSSSGSIWGCFTATTIVAAGNGRRLWYEQNGFEEGRISSPRATERGQPRFPTN